MRRTFVRRAGPAAALAVACALVAAGAAAWWVRAELARGDREIADGRLAEARRRLERLAWLRPEAPEVLYRLGVCEAAAGAPDRALAAWARVPAGSPLAAEAAAGRDRLFRAFIEGGRFAPMEDLLVASSRAGRSDHAEIGRALAQLLRLQGRVDEARRALVAVVDAAADPSAVLRELWAIDTEPVTVGVVRDVLDRAAARAPDDDRVWLGRANLALWSGALDEAGRLLDACEKRRPDDPAVGRARLNWGRAAGRAEVVAEALGRLPADALEPADRDRAEAWLAADRGDGPAERAALERVVAQSPGDAPSLGRLAAIAAGAGDADAALRYRLRKDAADRARDLGRKLLGPDASTIDLPTAGRLTESLGRWAEARGWWSLVLRFQPDHAEAREAVARLDARHAPSPRPAPASVAAAGPTRPTADPFTPAFRDDAEEAGLLFVHDDGRTDARHLPETMGGGVGLIDYDGDGWLDVYCVQGGPFPPASATAFNDRLFRNRGDGTFEDATARAGLAAFPGGYGHGVAVGDYDDDGRPDLFVTRWRSYALYRNRGDGTFEDATAAAGLGGDRDWPTSAAFADLDGDGDLDLYVAHYLAYDPARPPDCTQAGPDGTTRRSYCDPRKFDATADRLYRNDDGRFVDATKAAGVVDPGGRGLGVVAADLDGDRRVDLYIANDTTANFLFRNEGGLAFRETAVASGAAAGSSGGFQAGMGVACGDLDGDGRPDLAVTNFYGEGTTLYRNLGDGHFAEVSAPSGLAAATRARLGFGLAMLDVDRDGRPDLAAANGHVNDYRPTVPYAMPAQLLANVGGGRLRDVTGAAGTAWTAPRVGRGLAVGDLDNDGRPDVVLVDLGGRLVYLRNRTPGGHSVTLGLEGTRSGRDAVGARVAVEAGGVRRSVQRVGGGSYLSASDPRLHVGLGTSNRVDAIEVEWPSGRVDRYRDLPADAGYVLREGGPEARPLKGFPVTR